MPASLLNQITYNGHIYSVPVNIHRANVLWYNPTVAEEGRHREVPTTWAQFIAALKKAKDAGRDPARRWVSSGRRSTCSRRS